ncbi:MAG: cupin domain-containing protein [Bacteroidia bacterium]
MVKQVHKYKDHSLENKAGNDEAYKAFVLLPIFDNSVKKYLLMKNNSETGELAKETAHIIVEIIEYMPNAVVSKTIIKKSTGNITVSSLDAGEELAEKLSPFDTYVQIIDGTAELTIDRKKYNLKLGDGIIIPAHAKHNFNAKEQFKMICTIIKSGYED